MNNLSLQAIENLQSIPAEFPVAFQPGMLLRDIEKFVILETLKQQRFNRTKAARVLGIGIRTLQRKIKQYHQEGFSISAAS